MRGANCCAAICINNACCSTTSVYFSIRTSHRAGVRNGSWSDHVRTSLYLENLCTTKRLYDCCLSEPNKKRNVTVNFDGDSWEILTHEAV